MGATICLEDEVRKGRKSVVAVFLDVEKASGILWAKGLFIKPHQIRYMPGSMLGVGGNLFNWVLVFYASRLANRL